LSRDTAINGYEIPEPDGAGIPTVLDQSLLVPRLTVTAVAAALAVVAALLLRFTGLDRWPLTVAEAEIAHSAHDMIRGTAGTDHLFGAPSTVNWTALFFFAGWPADSVARISMAVAGLLVVLIVLSMRWILGASPAIWGAALIATSPTLIAASRRLDGGALIILLTLTVIGCAIITSARSQSLAWPAAAGAATALLFLAGPLGIPAVILAWLAVLLLIDRPSAPRAEAMIAGVAAGLGAVILSTTVFMTRPGNFASTIGELFSRFWDIHLSQVGQRGWLPTFNLILNEPLLLALAAVAIVASPYRSLVRGLTIWFMASFAVMTLLGDVSVAGYGVVVLPLALLAGAGLAHIVDRLPWRSIRNGTATVYILAVLLMVAAAISLIGLVTGGTGNGPLDWLVRFALVVLIGVLPLSVAISWLGQRLTGDRLVLVLAAGLVLLSAVTLRSSVLAASERPGMPGDPLADRNTSASVSVIVDRLHRVSRDLTMGQRSSQDPAGGHGLHVAIDENIRQPFAWYFRNFPNAFLFDPDQIAVPPGADIVILDGTRDPRVVAPGYTGEPYPFARAQPGTLRSPDWRSLATGIVEPDAWRAFVGYLINRQPETAPPLREFQVLAIGPVADRLFAASGPFNLDDRAGAGTAPGQMNRPRGVATGPDSTIYVVDSLNARVNVYDEAGMFMFSFGSEGAGPGQFGRLTGAGAGGASGIAVDVDGNIFVADTWNHRIQVFASDGTYLHGWGEFYDARDDPEATALRPGAFYGPRGLALHDGLLFVTDTGNERVQVFQTGGQFVTMFGTPGTGDGNLLEPVGIAVSHDGVVYVADSHNARIATFTVGGEWLEPIAVDEWTGQRFFEPYLATGPGGRIFGSASTTSVVLAIDPDTRETSRISAAELRQPFGLAVVANGTELLVTDGAVQSVIRIPVAIE
jgi:DNA-binding beta-propeller fold protein YncE